MTIRSQFFDSVAGDRVYTSNDFSAHLRGIYSDGVIQDNDTDGLKVLQQDTPDKSVKVSIGKCFIQGRFVEIFNTAETLTVPDNTSGLVRFDAVKIRVNFVNRTGELFYDTGDNISAPLPTRDDTVWELTLAIVTAADGFTSITQANIADRRNDIFLSGKSKPTTLRQNFQNAGVTGWRRIAVTNGFFQTVEPQTNNVAFANFVIRSRNTTDGRNDQMNVAAGVLNGNPVLEVSGRSRNNAGRNFDGVRIVFDPTFADARAAIEVFVVNANSTVTYEIYDNYSNNGWFPLNWTAGSLPGGFSECKLDFSLVDMVYGFATGQEILNAYTIDREGEIRTRGTPITFSFTANNVGLQGVQTDGTTFRNLIKLNNFNNIEIGSTARQAIISSLGLGPQFFDGANIFDIIHEGYVLPQARVFHNANQSIATGVATALAFNSERWDSDIIHDNVTNNSRLTAKTKGLYQIELSMEWASNATGQRQVFIQANGTTPIATLRMDAAAASTTQMSISTQYRLNVNDFVEAFVFQNSGGNLDVTTNAQFSPEFSMAFLSGF